MAHADAAAEEGRAFDGSASGSDNDESPFTGAEDGGKSKGVIRASQQEISGTGITGKNTAATSFKDKNNKNRTI